MLTLAIDTSARHFSLVLLREDELVAVIDSRTYCPKENGSRLQVVAKSNTKGPGKPLSISSLLFPAIEELFHKAHVQIRDIDLIAVARGPGSFTGLRIGVVAAKTLAYVVRTPIVGVDTLEAISAQTAIGLGEQQALIRPVLNAQRQQLFSAAYRSTKDWTVEQVEPGEIFDRSDWLGQVMAGNVVTGTGLSPLEEDLKIAAKKMGNEVSNENGFRIAPRDFWECSAESVGRMGKKLFLAGQSDDLWKLEPFYFRPSAAEEVLEAKRRR